MNAKKFLSKIIRLEFILISLCLPAIMLAAPTDFDGDGKSDFAVRRVNPDNSLSWYVLQSRDGFRAFNWGRHFADTSDITVVNDYDGDGRTDVGVWRSNNQGGIPAYWYVLKSSDNSLLAAQWGLSAFDDLAQADYDGDGKTDFAVYRDGWWYIQRSRDGFYAEKFGLPDDHPLPGNDYDGDGKADLAVIRYFPGSPGSAVPGVLYIRLSGSGTWQALNIGDARITWVVSGDYDGDGKSDIVLWRNRQWLWVRSSNNQVESVLFGQAGDAPVPGDYDGDGKTDPAVVRIEGFQYYFYVLQSRDGFKAVQWGGANTDSIVSAYAASAPVGF